MQGYGVVLSMFGAWTGLGLKSLILSRKLGWLLDSHGLKKENGSNRLIWGQRVRKIRSESIHAWRPMTWNEKWKLVLHIKGDWEKSCTAETTNLETDSEDGEANRGEESIGAREEIGTCKEVVKSFRVSVKRPRRMKGIHPATCRDSSGVPRGCWKALAGQ